MSRYPFTDAYDWVRANTTEYSKDQGMFLPRFSRGDVAQIVHTIAPALGMDALTLATRIADYAKNGGSVE